MGAFRRSRRRCVEHPGWRWRQWLPGPFPEARTAYATAMPRRRRRRDSRFDGASHNPSQAVLRRFRGVVHTSLDGSAGVGRGWGYPSDHPVARELPGGVGIVTPNKTENPQRERECENASLHTLLAIGRSPCEHGKTGRRRTIRFDFILRVCRKSNVFSNVLHRD